MTTARILTLADEVVKDLGAKQWEVAFELRGRKYTPKAKLEETDVVLVTVAVAGHRASRDSRDTWLYEYDIDVGVQFRASGDADATMHFDSCLRLCEQIADTYRFERPSLSDMHLAEVAIGGGSGQPYLPDHADNLNQFTGVVRLTFQDWRRKP